MGKMPKSTGFNKGYHDKQFSNPYYSTIKFCDWLVELQALNKKTKSICDMGCGKGANLYYMAKRFPQCRFFGKDIDKKVIKKGKIFLQNASIKNIKLQVGDIEKKQKSTNKTKFDGIVSLQTISWLSDYKKVIAAMSAWRPKWISFTSLFYDGPIEAKTIISEFQADGRTKKDFITILILFRLLNST